MHSCTTHHNFPHFLLAFTSAENILSLKISSCHMCWYFHKGWQCFNYFQKESTSLAQHAEGGQGGERKHFWKDSRSYYVFMWRSMCSDLGHRGTWLSTVTPNLDNDGRVCVGKEPQRIRKNILALSLKIWCFMFEIQNSLASVGEEGDNKM